VVSRRADQTIQADSERVIRVFRVQCFASFDANGRSAVGRRRGFAAAAVAALAAASVAVTGVASAGESENRTGPVKNKALQAVLDAVVQDG
jgi:hypothetical protein